MRASGILRSIGDKMARDPLWKIIVATLSADIAAGHYRPGDKLPTEAALALRFGVNRHTIRHALADLADRRLVRSRRGSGVFVDMAPTDYPIGRRVRFHQNLMAAGRLPGRRILRLETRPADPDDCAALALAAPARVHVCEGLSLADGTPIALFQSIFPADRLPDLPASLEETGSVTAALAACGIADYTRAQTRLTAQSATATQALHLHLRDGDPLIHTIGINVGVDGTPVEFGRTWFAADRVTLIVSDD
jgi:GntR family phosphonate transport system transcriptional regulator